jgi:hypothetical protein
MPLNILSPVTVPLQLLVALLGSLGAKEISLIPLSEYHALHDMPAANVSSNDAVDTRLAEPKFFCKLGLVTT